MGDVVGRSLPMPAWQDWASGHTRAVRVGRFKERAICSTCSTILTPRYDTFTATARDGTECVIRGAYVGPADDPVHHLLPFNSADMGVHEGGTDEQLATKQTPSPRPAGIPADAVAKGRSKDAPSRSPERRHAEYIRGRRRRRGPSVGRV